MRLASLFHDHAVLQRDLPLPVWGTGTPGETVAVHLAGRIARALVGPSGHWQTRLPPLPAGGPHELIAESPSGRAQADDVLIGEVWVCSGQSNMGMKLDQCGPLPEAGSTAAAECDRPRLRLLAVNSPASLARQDAVVGSWTPASVATLAGFSAVGGWFGRVLERALEVPVGLICTAWGGTRIQAWTSREALVRDPLGAAEVAHYEGYVHDPAAYGESYTSLADWEARGAPRDQGNRGLAEGWAAAAHDDAAWPTMPLPARWQDHGLRHSGVVWFRRTVTVPAAWRGRDLELRLGAIDKHDDTWVNGEHVGSISWNAGPEAWRTPRIYAVPARLVGADGTVVIAVRARSHVFDAGMIGPADAMRLVLADAPDVPIALAGPWRFRVEQDWGLVIPPGNLWGEGNPNAPYILFASRVAPLLPYAIRGVVWYQGESNAHEAAHYRRLLPAMIDDWRRAWGQGDFPFIQVQLANYKAVAEQPGASDWALLREAQAAALALPATGLAVAIDVGEAADIHPKDKRTVGERLARWALADTYGRGGLPGGPLFDSATVEAGGRVRIRFRHAAGLRTRDGLPPSHVSIAGLERTFRWAEAVIEGETLVVWHTQILRPAAVRYAWADNPAGCNLVNGDDLPAVPFRSDAW